MYITGIGSHLARPEDLQTGATRTANQASPHGLTPSGSRAHTSRSGDRVMYLIGALLILATFTKAGWTQPSSAPAALDGIMQ